MHIFNWLFGGILGGAFGAAVWVAIECTTGKEFAWMAWPIGLLVGWGVHKFAAADTRGGFMRGALAALLALAAILGAGWSKQKIMTKQAAQAATPAVVGASSGTGEDGQNNAETSGSDQVKVDLRELPTGRFSGTGEARSRNAFQNMDMLWLCLAALTAYVVGKGPGTDSAGSEEPASEELASEEPPAAESTDEVGDAS
jgi:hypothetical protein